MGMRIRIRVRIVGSISGAVLLAGAAAVPAHAAEQPFFSEGVAVNLRGETLGSFTVDGGYPRAGVFGPSGKLTYLSYPAGDEGATGNALNLEGYVAGAVQDGAGAAHPVLWSPTGKRIALSGTGTYGSALGLNDFGTAAGYVGDLPVRWSASGKVTDLAVPSDLLEGSAVAINDRNVAVGNLITKSGDLSVLWNADGTAVDLATPTGDRWTSTRDVNLEDTTVGLAVAADYSSVPVRWNARGAVTVLGTDSGQANGINDCGVTVGEVGVDNSVYAAAWSASGKQTLLPNLPGAVASEAEAINDRGDIVGFAETAAYTDDAVEWTPDGRVIDLTALSGS